MSNGTIGGRSANKLAKILKYPEKDAERHGPNENNEENSQIEITYSIFHTQIPFSICKRPACLEFLSTFLPGNMEVISDNLLRSCSRQLPLDEHIKMY